VSEGCYDDFYAGHNTVTADVDGDLVYAFDGATTPLGPATDLRSSVDGRRALVVGPDRRIDGGSDGDRRKPP
jgi:hypothetical protein